MLSVLFELSNSPYGSLVLVVLNTNGSFRMCIDDCALIAIALRYTYPLQYIDDLLEHLLGAH